MRTFFASCLSRESTCRSISSGLIATETRRSSVPRFSTFAISYWCEGRDSNPHAFRRQILSLVRLPIPPPSQKESTYYSHRGGGSLRELPGRVAPSAGIVARAGGNHLSLRAQRRR